MRLGFRGGHVVGGGQVSGSSCISFMRSVNKHIFTSGWKCVHYIAAVGLNDEKILTRDRRLGRTELIDASLLLVTSLW